MVSCSSRSSTPARSRSSCARVDRVPAAHFVDLRDVVLRRRQSVQQRAVVE
jgi:hypothetical protein